MLVGVVPDVLTHHEEFVAADPANGVPHPQRLLHALGNDLHHVVADLMPVGVVDRFEPVQVDEQHGHQGAAAVRGGQRVADQLLHQTAVGQPGQLIVQRPPGQLLLRQT